MMDATTIVTAVITACGGAAVSGFFALLKFNKERKAKQADKDCTILSKLSDLEKKLDAHINEDAEYKSDESRARILRFGDEVRQGVLHTSEHWADILRDVDRYEDFCSGHPMYENNRATTTIAFLKEIYAEHLKKNDFLR